MDLMGGTKAGRKLSFVLLACFLQSVPLTGQHVPADCFSLRVPTVLRCMEKVASS